MSFYSMAPAPENQAAGRFSFRAKDAELILESPIATSQAAPSSTAHTPHTATPPATSLTQTIPVKYVTHTHSFTYTNHATGCILMTLSF